MKQENIIGSYMLKDALDMPRVLDDYYNYISTIIKHFQTMSIEDEEEIISDVFLIVWKNQKKLNKNLSFSPYIAGITKRVIYKKFKRKVSDLEIEDYYNVLVDKFNIEKLVEEHEMNNCIMDNLKKLGNQEYEIFTKFYYEDKKIKDIALELGISTTTAKTKLHRTREKVKQILKVGGFNKHE